MSPMISISRRLRSTPFSERVVSSGVRGYTVYNHMLLPTVFSSIEDDYRHLKTAVQLWDVACERQVEIRGRDAGRLVQMLTPRDMRPMTVGQCYYTPMVDETGGMLNDPVTLKLSEDRYWVSIADSDLLYWIKGLAYGFRLEVDVTEPDISPLAVQGPKADALITKAFGEEITGIRFFRFREVEIFGMPMIIARSGYSRQGGFEIYCNGTENGLALWDLLSDAGQEFDVRAGCPNLIERIEGGLLSYGNDMTRANTPHECGLGRFCDTAVAIGCVGRDALLRVAQEGPRRQIRSLSIDGPAVPPCHGTWALTASGSEVGHISSAAWSPDFNTNVALGMVHMNHWTDGTRLTVICPDGPRTAIVHEHGFRH